MKKTILLSAFLFSLLVLSAVVSAETGIHRYDSSSDNFYRETYGLNTIPITETWKIKDDIDDEDRTIKVTHTVNVPRYTFVNEASSSNDIRSYNFPDSTLNPYNYPNYGLGAYSNQPFRNSYPRFSQPYYSRNYNSPNYYYPDYTRNDNTIINNAFSTLNSGRGFRYGYYPERRYYSYSNTPYSYRF